MPTIQHLELHFEVQGKGFEGHSCSLLKARRDKDTFLDLDLSNECSFGSSLAATHSDSRNGQENRLAGLTAQPPQAMECGACIPTQPGAPKQGKHTESLRPCHEWG